MASTIRFSLVIVSTIMRRIPARSLRWGRVDGRGCRDQFSLAEGYVEAVRSARRTLSRACRALGCSTGVVAERGDVPSCREETRTVMEYRTVGASGLRVSRLGLGTLTWGRGTDGDEAAAQLSAFVDVGGTLVDTSPAYGDGVAQRILAELLDDVVPRDQLVLSGSSGIDTTTLGSGRVDCSRSGLLNQLDATLRELGTDHLDVWQVATWDPHTPVDEVMDALEFAVTSGRVRYVGVRGYLGWQLATAAAAARRPAPLISTQVEYSLLARGVEEELIPAAAH